MSKKKSALILGMAATVCAGFALAYSDPGQEGSTPEGTLITVEVPKEGDLVTQEMTVRGTARVPEGSYVWLLARRHDFEPLWWPQREIKVDPRTYEWSATANFGIPADAGSDFDLGVITVNEESHNKIRQHWLHCMESGNWTPMQIDSTTSPPKILRVHR